MKRTRLGRMTGLGITLAFLCGALGTAPGPAMASAEGTDMVTAGATGEVVVSTPRSYVVDTVIDGVATHWGWSQYLDLGVDVDIEDPDRIVKKVEGAYVIPEGRIRTFTMKRNGRSSWRYDPDGLYAVGPGRHPPYGTWTLSVTARDAEGNEIAEASREIDVRDPMTATHPRVVSIRTQKHQVKSQRACPPDTDGHRYCQVKAVLTIYDPDKIAGYTFMRDKGPRWHATTNWYGARSQRVGDHLIYRDTVPVSGVSGRHTLMVTPQDVSLRRSWPRSYFRGVPATFGWTLRVKR